MRLEPKLRRPTDEQGRVTPHRLVKFSIDAAARRECLDFLERLEVPRDARAGLVHIAGAERDEQIAGLQSVANDIMRFVQAWQKFRRHFAMTRHRIDKRLTRHARDRRLGGGIDIADENQIGCLQNFSEIIGKRLRARVAMRLEKHDEPFRIERAGSLQRGRKLRRVMSVIIDDAEICRQIACFESPFRAGKCRKCAGNQREFRTAGVGQGDGCERVENIVTPGNAEFDVAEHLAALGHGEGRRSTQVAHIARFEIRISPAVRNRVCALTAKLARDGILGAIDQGATGLIRHFREHLADVIEVTIEIQMLGLDVENHRVLGPIDRERAVAFITLGDHVFAVL